MWQLSQKEEKKGVKFVKIWHCITSLISKKCTSSLMRCFTISSKFCVVSSVMSGAVTEIEISETDLTEIDFCDKNRASLRCESVTPILETFDNLQCASLHISPAILH